ncbi:type II toxin-antitoxin system Phd/YefM family antitoxin [Neisseria animalis]|uniref:Antitoxin n=1 Tax=Neisseria animalis TaxID=492 RepID=A0A5P3MQ14_NEIAN|nr:type II toxin-antitoxin system prevent-host-death family antitoxin [Neisseria animalis]QEY23510.1 type II toxin-antitoxin system prevent-host-death family antitoxin [Neisseria animalis]ROW33356.1 type II toxin-antitoxin system prevent-host-death family antitoxin [Neisseria animalis]VEE09108.1 prevent-host-death family protein [Neisseria animalis]
MQTVNIHEAKTNLSRLLEGAVHGEPFIIAKAGKPMVQVLPYQSEHKKNKRIGFMPDMQIPDDFNEMGTTEISALFGGATE